MKMNNFKIGDEVCHWYSPTIKGVVIDTNFQAYGTSSYIKIKQYKGSELAYPSEVLCLVEIYNSPLMRALRERK